MPAAGSAGTCRAQSTRASGRPTAREHTRRRQVGGRRFRAASLSSPVMTLNASSAASSANDPALPSGCGNMVTARRRRASAERSAAPSGSTVSTARAMARLSSVRVYAEAAGRTMASTSAANRLDRAVVPREISGTLARLGAPSAKDAPPPAGRPATSAARSSRRWAWPPAGAGRRRAPRAASHQPARQLVWGGRRLGRRQRRHRGQGGRCGPGCGPFPGGQGVEALVQR